MTRCDLGSLASGVAVGLFVACALAGDAEGTTSSGDFNAGVGVVDITPTEPVVLAGSPTPKTAQ